MRAGLDTWFAKAEGKAAIDYGFHMIMTEANTSTIEDMAAAVSYLKSKGVRMQGDPTTLTQGPIAGVTFEYFLAPWGMQMELVSAPAGAAYEKDDGQKLWTPKDPGH